MHDKFCPEFVSNIIEHSNFLTVFLSFTPFGQANKKILIMYLPHKFVRIEGLRVPKNFLKR